MVLTSQRLERLVKKLNKVQCQTHHSHAYLIIVEQPEGVERGVMKVA